ncbi:hypothetical protein [Bacillus dakarensis]|nr:hypothetical protein [Bacillus dakarensis]
MPQKVKIDHIPNSNPIRERLKNKDAADFSSATLRRLALFQQGRMR